MNTYGELLLRQFAEHWQDLAISTVDGESIRYGDLWCTACAVAESWQAEGLQPGDIIAFKLPNSYRIPCLYLACAIGGFVACPIVPTLSEKTAAENLETVKPKRVITQVDFPLVTAGDKPAFHELDSHQPFLIMFSSGSTGRSKAICHSLDNVCGSAAAFSRLSGFDETTRLYHVLPMTYMAGFLNSMLAVLVCGGRIIEGPQFSMENVADFWRYPLQSEANVLSLIPPLAATLCRLTRNPETLAKVPEQFTQVQCTSQAIQADLRARFMKKFSLPLQDCYGMTELGGPMSLQSRDDATQQNEFSTMIEGPEVQIRSNEDGGSELWIRSPFAMLGYLKDGELEDIRDAGGFIDTGDLADYRPEPDGERIRITGRVKDIIIRGGINISPGRIESVMSQAPGVEEVAVVGLPHAYWGEQIIACVVGGTGESELLNYCRESLDGHEVPDRIEFMEAFPRSFIGKVLKNDLRDKLTA
ncbi:MAG: acyl--CoA ligase [Pseudomonadales bacterium]|jgi:acyl-CoA synthetase (AMP-forming)/AMP-acid ligase II|nr:acyl--CoA ligase [Pseudomonadales bacterium]